MNLSQSERRAAVKLHQLLCEEVHIQENPTRATCMWGHEYDEENLVHNWEGPVHQKYIRAVREVVGITLIGDL